VFFLEKTQKSAIPVFAINDCATFNKLIQFIYNEISEKPYASKDAKISHNQQFITYNTKFEIVSLKLLSAPFCPANFESSAHII